MKKLLFSLLLLLSIISKAQTINDPEWMRQMGSRTAKQTWWFFDKRLKESLDYSFQHVYIEYMNVYIKDIKQLPSGKYQGIVDLDFPHDPAFTENNQEIKFDSAEIDDWFMVKDRYLVGGFILRFIEFNAMKPIKRLGGFNIPFQSINEDFIESSRIPPSIDEDYFAITDLDKVFPGGEKGLRDSVMARLVYTEYAHEMGIEGYVNIRFTLSQDGIIEDLRVVRGVGAGLNDTTKNAFFKLKRYWKPYLNKNHMPVDVHFTYPIRFSFRDYMQTFK